jgi:hypothetical protein
MRFAWRRIEVTLVAGGIDEQSRCRLIEARDTLADATAHRLGNADVAQDFLHEDDGYRRVDAGHPTIGMERKASERT